MLYPIELRARTAEFYHETKMSPARRLRLRRRPTGLGFNAWKFQRVCVYSVYVTGTAGICLANHG